MANDCDQMMEEASQALVRMEYLGCEALCLQALVATREKRDWPYYGRVLLPLQEARRQRRIIASEGKVRLGTPGMTGLPGQWLDEVKSGCIALTRPHGMAAARKLDAAARAQNLCVEVLFIDNEASDAQWTVVAFNGPRPHVRAVLPAPSAAWVDRWVEGISARGPTAPVPKFKRPAGGVAVAEPASARSATAADWFLDACEQLGDAAMNEALNTADLPARLAALERCLEVVTDHEKIHQRLGDTARALALGS